MSERFWAKVDQTETCWLWTAAKNTTGYGAAWHEGRAQVAHRVAYELLRGPIPAGLQLDHLCRVRHCVNPDHLEPVTNRENALRGQSPNMLRHHAGRCKYGHFLDDAIRDRAGRLRNCRTCKRIKRTSGQWSRGFTKAPEYIRRGGK